jgi:hypothetical protein
LLLRPRHRDVVASITRFGACNAAPVGPPGPGAVGVHAHVLDDHAVVVANAVLETRIGRDVLRDVSGSVRLDEEEWRTIQETLGKLAASDSVQFAM